MTLKIILANKGIGHSTTVEYVLEQKGIVKERHMRTLVIGQKAGLVPRIKKCFWAEVSNTTVKYV